MCGLSGFINLDGRPADEEILRAMNAALAHRGPDGEGVWGEGPVGLGHRRLAIIDLSPAAAQPMATPDGRFHISYNGEIYNFKELRRELERSGARFRSRSDTEVVLEAFARWGEAAVERFNGMFALAVWDGLNQELFLARDRYGIKPLYYARQGEVFIFGSEAKAILAHPACRVELDREALLEYFTFQNFFTERTLLQGVKILPAGTWLRLGPKTRAEPQVRRYWDFNFEEPEAPAEEMEYVEELDRLFRRAVERQLVSDVELGSYLSGGMDSGSITAIAARRLPFIKTFTCGFDLHSASGLELSFDEREQAEFMSYLFQTEHYEMVLKAGDMERCLPRVAWHIEEPRVGQSYPNYYISRLASKFVKVVLAGTGGDELFGGYPWRYFRALRGHGFEDYIDNYYLFWQRLIPNQVIRRVFEPIWGEVSHVWTRDIFRDVFATQTRHIDRLEDYVNHALYFEAKTFLHGLLVVEDKLAMAHGLEVRVPFLDNDLVDFALKVPVSLKFRNPGEVARINENEPGHKVERYFHQTRDGKLLLRQAMERYIPGRITNGVKQGFSAPDASWFKGESIDYVRRIIFDPRARIYEFMAPEAVQELVGEHLDGRRNRRLLIWSLLNFEWWCRQFL